MTLKHVLKHFSKTNSEDLGAKGAFAIAQDDGTHPTHLSQTILNRLFGRVLEKEGVKVSCAEHTVTVFSPFTSHFSQLCTPHPSPLPQGAREQTSCAKHTETDLSSNRPTVLTTSKKAAFTLAEVFSSHCAGFRKAAFTLAEVLITLGIIGVVAAMTLPTLIQNHQKQTYVTGLKKAYANLQNAFAKMAYDEGVTDWSQTYCGSGYPYDISEECFNRFKKQFNVVKSEYFEDEGNVWGLILDGHTQPLQLFGYFYTNDGMSYVYDCGGRGLLVDVNGDKGPNRWGRDRFMFEVQWTKNKIVPLGRTSDGMYEELCTTSNVNSQPSYSRVTIGAYCTAKVLIEGKMDY